MSSNSNSTSRDELLRVLLNTLNQLTELIETLPTLVLTEVQAQQSKHRPRNGVEPELVKIEEAALILSVSERTIYRYANEGKIQMRGHGRLRRVVRRSLDDFIERDDDTPGEPPNIIAPRL
jgi:excisionase family DNA binding protein